MKVWLDLPDDVAALLIEKGQDIPRVALEALAVDAYRTNRITGYQLGRLLAIPSRYELDGFLKRHGVPLDYTVEEFEREGDASARLRDQRETGRAPFQVRERPPE